MKYKVVQNSDLKRFQDVVNNNIKLGWELQGGICVYDSSFGTTWYHQAMIKKEK